MFGAKCCNQVDQEAGGDIGGDKAVWVGSGGEGCRKSGLDRARVISDEGCMGQRTLPFNRQGFDRHVESGF